MMAESRLNIRMSKEELEELDKALKIMGYKDRSDWIREKRRELIREAEKKLKVNDD